MAQDQAFAGIPAETADIGIRKIGVNDLWQALRQGFADFSARPTHIAFLSVIYPLVALMLVLVLTGENLLPLAFPMVSGFTLLGPIVAIALCEMSRRREQGLDMSWRSAFGFVHSADFAPILALSLLLILLYVAWLYMAQFIYFSLFGAAPPDSVADFINQVMTTRRGGALMFYGSGVGFIFAVVALSISVVAFPLILDRHVSALTAMKASINAVATNPLILAVWGLTIVVLLSAGAVVFLIGLAVVLPVLGHATWHLYRSLIEH